jgi:TonB family protein
MRSYESINESVVMDDITGCLCSHYVKSTLPMRIWWSVILALSCVLRLAAQHSIGYVDGNHQEWKRDLDYMEAPAYPAVAKRWHVQGAGVFRVSIDINIGRVTDVAVLKSTGYGVLDGSAIRTLKLWRWKPGKYRSVNVPISFKLDPRWAKKPFPGASPLPRSRY